MLELVNKLFGKDNNHIKVFLHLLNSGGEISFVHCAKCVGLAPVTVRGILEDFEDVGIVTVWNTTKLPKYLPMMRCVINKSSPITVALVEFLNKISKI